MKISILFMLAMTFMFISTSQTLAQSTIEKAQIDKSTKTIKTKVKGITCSTDLKMISTNVELLKGVSSCKAGKSGPTTSFDISYNPSIITEKEIQTAIQNTGSCENPNERPYKIKQ